LIQIAEILRRNVQLEEESREKKGVLQSQCAQNLLALTCVGGRDGIEHQRGNAENTNTNSDDSGKQKKLKQT
jgi:hypothetical protein